MRIAVVGVGGTGGYLGGLLARAGQDVTFIARGANLAALRTTGLTVRSTLLGDSTAPVQATDDPHAVGPVDLVLFCVKAYDTATALEQVHPLIGPETMILSVQNGIENEDQIAAAVGGDHVIGTTAAISAVLEEPGVVTGKGEPAILRFGELAGGTSERTERLAPIFQQAGITAEVHTDIRVGLWDKLIGICALSGVTSLTRQPLGVIMATPETKVLFRGVIDEVGAVGRAHGIALPAGVEDRWMGNLEAIARNAPQVCGSMYYDLIAGRRLEVEMLNGTVARLGHEHGVPTPMNFAIYAALKPYADGAPTTQA